LRFRQQDDGSVAASFPCDGRYQGYPDRLHGGVIALLLDAAMIHCLFARGHHAYTARLSVQFRHPIAVGEPAMVRGWYVGESPSLFILRAEVHQSGLVRAVAEGVFARQASGVTEEESQS
jgi:acyl-coenzyme A thioesterase PaaI-like protein